MILQPTFFDHWKTRQLILATGRPESPLWVQRLWGFCQTSRKHRFKKMQLESLKAICAVSEGVSAVAWGRILADCRLIDLDDSDGETISFTVHEWKQQNSGLLSSRTNGLTGGRPRKNQRPTQRKPTNNPQVSTSQPTLNLQGGGLDRIGLDRIGLDQIRSIYAAYPRHVARAAAFKAIRTAVTKIEPAALLAKVEAFAAAVALWPADERGFAPYPATWFNAEQWADDPAQWVRPVRGGGEQKNVAVEGGARTADPLIFGQRDAS